jgi:2-oxoglutarate ferredoxin oxidoreductase subunit delta
MAKKAQINFEKCKGCDLCIDVCPKAAIHKSGISNKKGYDYIEIDLDQCNGCGACYIICPDCCFTIVETASSAR